MLTFLRVEILTQILEVTNGSQPLREQESQRVNEGPVIKLFIPYPVRLGSLTRREVGYMKKDCLQWETLWSQ